MAITVTVRMATGISQPVVEKTATHIEIAGLTKYTQVDVDEATQNVYRVQIEKTGQDTAKSVAFTCDDDGGWVWDGYVFPASGSWNIKVYSLHADGSLNSSVKTQAVTVAAS